MDTINPLITVYRDVKTIDEPHYVRLELVLNRIKSDYYRNKIGDIRTAQDTIIKRNLKASLPSVLFSGVFEKRTDKGIKQHSGLVVLDFDHIENIQGFKEAVCKDEFTFAAFISPSGDGLKVLVRIPADSKYHEKHYMALMKKYPQLDPTSRNISRVCYISHDPKIYINHNAKVFTDKVDKVTNQTVKEIVSTIDTDYSSAQIACDLIRNSIDGNKHHNLIKASRLMGGFISGGIVEEYEAVRLLELEINKKNPDNFKAACKTIQDGINYGKMQPIQRKEIKQRVEKIVSEEIIIPEEPAKDVIFLQDIEDRIWTQYENGISKSETTHFNNLDNHWKWRRGELNLMHGIANHGKSAAVYQLCLIKSVKEGYKWGVFSPENMPEEEFYKDLIHSFIGKSTEKHHSNQMSRSELQRGISFIKDHFFLIYPKDESPTPDYIHNRFRELLIKNKIDGCIIDPFNQLDNDMGKFGGRDDQYLSTFLTKCKRFAVELNLFYIIIAHPRSGLTMNNGNYEMPNVYSLAGGAMWVNKCDNILITHRPNYSTNPSDTTVQIGSQKIKKQKLNGIPGWVSMQYDRNTARYTDLGISPLGKVDIAPQQDIEFNTNFLNERIENVPF